MPGFDTDFVFKPGKLTIVLDGGAGSSGKGKLGSFLCEHSRKWKFACNTFMPQAGHWVELANGRRFLYQTLNSCAYDHNLFEKLYIAPGAAIELPLFFKELWENKIPPGKVGISPVTAVLQDFDKSYERGTHTLEGDKRASVQAGGPLARTGSTAHGCGANRARRVLRRPEAKYARDVPELRDFICDVPREIMARLDAGQAGLLEVAQGFQLSYLLNDFFPHTTSRNCTVAAALDDLMVPPVYAGTVLLNFRTFPIRIHDKVYVDKASGRHLTWAQKEAADPGSYTTVGDSSGPNYPDQKELSWDAVTELSGSPTAIHEMSSVTRLPRRVFSFSRVNVDEAIRHNRTDGELFLSLNFANYVDHALSGRSARVGIITAQTVGDKLNAWLRENLNDPRLRFIGTGPKTNEMIQVG